MFKSPQVIWAPGMELEQLEKQVILAAIEFYKGNKTSAAASLGVCVRTLTNKLAIYEAEEQVRKKNEDERRRERQAYLARCRGQNPETEKVHVGENTHEKSVDQNSSELSMPVPKRKEIQDVLPDQVTDFGKKRSRA